MITLKRVLHHLGLVLALLSVVFAVLLSSLSLFTPLLNRYPAFFEALTMEYLHRPVTFGEVSLTWHRLQPMILLKNVEINKNSTQESMIRMKQLGFGINILSSMFEHRLSLGHLVFKDVESRGYPMPGKTFLFTGYGDGDLQLSNQGGSATLTLHHVQMVMGDLFRAPLPVDKLNLNVAWVKTNVGTKKEKISVDVKNITWRSAEADITGQMKMIFHTANKDQKSLTLPSMDSTLQFSFHHLASPLRYLPISVMPSSLVAWLDHAIVRARDVSGHMVLKGNLGYFPFENHRGTFRVEAQCEGVQLQYDPAWPVINDLSAKLLFKERRLEISVDHGSILNSAIHTAQATIPYLGDKAFLFVDGKLQGTTQDGIQFIRKSPLHIGMDEAFRDLKTRGNFQLGLKLVVPLDDTLPQKTRVVGNVALDSSSWTFPLVNLGFEKLTGNIHFTENTINGTSITAYFLGRPVNITVFKSLLSTVTRVALDTVVDFSDVVKHFPGHFERYFSGSSAVRAYFEFPSPQSIQPARFVLLSNMVGSAIHIPSIFKKEALQTLPLNIQIPLKRDPVLNVQLKIGKLFNGSLSFSEERGVSSVGIDAAAVQGRVILPPVGKTTPWQLIFKRLYVTPTAEANLSTLSLSDIPSMDVNIDDFRYGDWALGQLKVVSRSVADAIRIDQLMINNPQFSMNAEGIWRKAETGMMTHLEGVIISQDVGGSLRRWGLPPEIESNNARALFSLSWPEAPFSPEIGKLSGDLQLTMQEGRLTDLGGHANVEMGLGRLLTLLSLETIPRRLNLDFSDLKSKGFSFDSLRASFSFSKGSVFTQNAEVEGPMAGIKMQGRIGLVQKDYDVRLEITPHLTASIPIVATLAGGPAVGAIAWVVNQVLGSTVNKITAQTYHMAGPWNKPKIERVVKIWENN